MVKIIQTELQNKGGGSGWLTRVITFITTACTRVCCVVFPTVLGSFSVKPCQVQTVNEEENCCYFRAINSLKFCVT
jgi:hypothetical protein